MDKTKDMKHQAESQPKKQILLISPEAWGDNFVSKHHYATYLSKDHDVYFLDPPDSFSFGQFGNMGITEKQVNPQLTVLKYKNLVPKLYGMPKFLQRIIYSIQARKILRKTGKQFDMVWSFDPYRFFDQRAWKTPLRLYFSFDLHRDRIFEQLICETSTHFFSSAKGLQELLRKEFHVNAVNLGHGFDEAGAKIIQAQQLPGENKVKIVYTGNISQFIDLGFFKTLFEQFKQADFIFIGPVGTDSNLGGKVSAAKESQEIQQQCPNVFFLGQIRPEKLFAYTSQADLLLFYDNKKNYNPHKLMLYFYSGAITLSSPITEYAEDSFLMVQSHSNAEFSNKMAEILQNLETLNSDAQREKRRQFALSNSYVTKIQQVFAAIRS